MKSAKQTEQKIATVEQNLLQRREYLESVKVVGGCQQGGGISFTGQPGIGDTCQDITSFCVHKLDQTGTVVRYGSIYLLCGL